MFAFGFVAGVVFVLVLASLHDGPGGPPGWR